MTDVTGLTSTASPDASGAAGWTAAPPGSPPGQPSEDMAGGFWSETRWASEARLLREALRILGLNMVHCLPDEPVACGASADLHYASYLGFLRARLELFWRNLDDGHQLATAVSAFQDETLAALRREQQSPVAGAASAAVRSAAEVVPS